MRDRSRAWLIAEASSKQCDRRAIGRRGSGKCEPARFIREGANAQSRNAHAGPHDWRSTRASHLATDGRSLRLSECRSQSEHDARNRKEARNLTCHSHTHLAESETGWDMSRIARAVSSIAPAQRLCWLHAYVRANGTDEARRRCSGQIPEKSPSPGILGKKPDIAVT